MRISPFFLTVQLTILGGAFASVARAEAIPDDPPRAKSETKESFAGVWETTFGLMDLKQDGRSVTGAYGLPDQENAITGTLDGRKLTFTYVEPGVEGEGWFELGADGKSFKGKWRPNGAGPAWADWEGKRSSKTIKRAVDSFDGLWNTTYGKMRLHLTDNTIEGIYSFAGRSSIRGTVEGKRFRFTYEQPDGEKGEGAYTLADDGKSFSGTWKSAQGGGGNWTGTRVPREPGRVWLVVLEAPWEANLADQEYSFGQMLRAFFSRTPHVKVRHRFFHDEADLRRWCAELPYLAEPIVLYISSHGTEQGIAVGGATLDAKTLADCLKSAGDIKLLHLGACLAMNGSLPKDLSAALAATGQRRFPISGYKRVADWGGSAVIDFAYLDLIFSRNRSPADAVKQIREAITFAREDAAGSISPSGLTIYEPD